MNDHIYRKAIMTGTVLTVMIMLLSIMTPLVFAGSNVPVTVDINVTYIVDGNVKTAGGDRFTLTPDDPYAPMPDGAVGGTKTITIKDEGCYGFGDICYERPEVYWYTITRETTEKKGVIKDESIYRAKVIALNDGHGYVLVYKKGSDEKQELVYTDRVAPATADDSRMIVYSFIAIAAASALVVFTVARKKKKRGRH